MKMNPDTEEKLMARQASDGLAFIALGLVITAAFIWLTGSTP